MCPRPKSEGSHWAEDDSSVIGESGRLVVQSRGSWVMQWKEEKTVRDTVARRNGGNCNSPMGRKGLGVTCRMWWLHARMGGRREALPLNGGSVGMRGCEEALKRDYPHVVG